MMSLAYFCIVWQKKTVRTCTERELSKCGYTLTSWLTWNVGYKIMKRRTYFMETSQTINKIIIQ